MLAMIRNLILGIGWPILIAGSIYIFVEGGRIYKLVKGSLIGKVTRALVVSMLVGMYSLGIVCTVFMFTNVKSAYLVLPIFGAWFVSFVWSIKVLRSAKAEAEKLTGGKISS